MSGNDPRTIDAARLVDNLFELCLSEGVRVEAGWGDEAGEGCWDAKTESDDDLGDPGGEGDGGAERHVKSKAKSSKPLVSKVVTSRAPLAALPFVYLVEEKGEKGESVTATASWDIFE